MRTNIALVIATILLTSCSYVQTEKANLAAAPKGVRVYPSQLYIAVDTVKGQSTIFYAPDMLQAYDVKPVSIFSKHDFQIDVEDGQIKSLKSDQDSSGFLTFFQSLTGTALKASGLPVSSTNIPLTFGLQSGLYKLDYNNNFVRVPVQQ